MTISVQTILRSNLPVGYIGNAVVTTTTSNNVIDTFSTSLYRSAKYYIQITDNTNYYSSEYLVMHDNTNATGVEYAILYSNNSLANVTSDVSGGNVRLLVAPNTAGAIVKFKRVAVEA